MEEVHKEAITKNLVALCRDIVLEPLLTLLMEKKIFSTIDFQYIMVRMTILFCGTDVSPRWWTSVLSLDSLMVRLKVPEGVCIRQWFT